MTDDTLQQRAITLIKPLIPPDAEERTGRAFRQWNQIVRDHIRNETGQKLADGDGRNAVSVKIADGFPHLLAQLADTAIPCFGLIVGQPKLGGVIDVSLWIRASNGER